MMSPDKSSPFNSRSDKRGWAETHVEKKTNNYDTRQNSTDMFVQYLYLLLVMCEVKGGLAHRKTARFVEDNELLREMNHLDRL